ncbi:hypothetical protein [Arthrobacter sp. AFG20]|uniref:hypothetical protein n=1 Tax=Arthrobacter sp. AFG20 TaxID=1688671 RepID=UPI000C9DD8B8|nr:hypothetical protein [Arthrobacter sp. AFG20]PNH85193.1 hypothetical protein CXZ05_06635 [Arthrobacter sp. AFG20]
MTTTPTIRSRHSFSTRFAMISTVSLGLLAGPIAIAAPASAMGDNSRKADCTVTALDPYAKDHGRNAFIDNHGNKGGDRNKSVRVAFAFKIRCDKDADVRYNQKMFQKHGHRDIEKIGDAWDTVSVSGHHEKIVNVERVTADRGDRFVKAFHAVWIRVEDNNRGHGDHRNSSSDFDRSNTVTIWVSNNHR